MLRTPSAPISIDLAGRRDGGGERELRIRPGWGFERRFVMRSRVRFGCARGCAWRVGGSLQPDGLGASLTTLGQFTHHPVSVGITRSLSLLTIILTLNLIFTRPSSICPYRWYVCSAQRVWSKSVKKMQLGLLAVNRCELRAGVGALEDGLVCGQRAIGCAYACLPDPNPGRDSDPDQSMATTFILTVLDPDLELP